MLRNKFDVRIGVVRKKRSVHTSVKRVSVVIALLGIYRLWYCCGWVPLYSTATLDVERTKRSLRIRLPVLLLYFSRPPPSPVFIPRCLRHRSIPANVESRFVVPCRVLCFRSESLVPEECSVEELESGEMRAICTSEGKEYIYRVRYCSRARS